MTIYTGRGDEGETDLFDGTRVPKTAPRVTAYGTVDELNALVGVIRPTGHAEVDARLETTQNDLHVLQAALANPDESGDVQITETHVTRVEDWIDDAESQLEPQTAFILPGGSEAGSQLHHARTVCRRAERKVLELAEAEPVSSEAITYLNRLSDWLYVSARLVNAAADEPEENPTY